MRVHVLSDLHLEQAAFEPPRVDCDVVVLAGDIHPGVRGVRWARDAFPDRPVLYVAGNHEFWDERLPDLYGDLRAAAEGSSVRVLEGDAVTIDGVRFLGATLWTDFALYGHPEREALACRRLPDFRRIAFAGGERKLTPEDTIELHAAARSFLERELAPAAGPSVVVTHHAPHRLSGDPRFTGERSSAAFSSHLEDLILEHRPALWIHGHLHWSFDYGVGPTRIVCNPRGYPGEATGGFDPALVIELDATPG